MPDEKPLAPGNAPARKRRRWLRREAIDLGDVVVQIFSVLVGMVLALFVNNWVQQRQQRATVNDAIQAIHAELVANRATVRNDTAGLYRTARVMLDSPKNRGASPRACYQWDGFEFPALILTDAAYQAAISTQALAHMPFKQAQGIAEAYESQRSFLRQGRSLTEGHLTAGAPQTLDACVLWLQGAEQIDKGIDDAYTPLIGPDRSKWPAPYTGWAPFPVD